MARWCPECEQVREGLFHVYGTEVVCTECYPGVTASDGP